MQQNWKNKIFILTISFLFILLVIPSHFKAFPILAAFLVLLLHIKKKKINFSFFLLTSLLYIALLITILYSNNFKYGSSFLFETQILLLIFPLFFSLLPKKLINLIIEKQNFFFLIYIIAIFFYALSPLLWFFAPYHYDIKKILFHFSGIINSADYALLSIHPIYMAVAIGWALILSFFLLLKTQKNNIKIGLILIDLYFIIILFILAKMTTLFSFLTSSLLFLYLYKKKVFFHLSPIIITLGFLLISTAPNTKKRLQEILKIEQKNIQKNTSTGKHLRIWKASIKTFKKAPLFGYGLGSHKDFLIKAYKEEKQNDLLKQKLSTHNQYLSFLLIGGIFLLIVYITMIIISGKIAWQNKNYLMLIFLLYFSIIMLTENYLEREDGIVLFALFFNYLNIISFYKQNSITKK